MRFFVIGPRVLGFRAGASFRPADLRKARRGAQAGAEGLSRREWRVGGLLALVGFSALAWGERGVGLPWVVVVGADAAAVVVLAALIAAVERFADRCT